MAMAMSLDVKVFHETEGAIVRGEYSTPSGPRKFLASRAIQEDVDYYSAEEVEDLIEEADSKLASTIGGGCKIEVCEKDSLVAALDVQAARVDADDDKALPVLVLNFANAFSAGGNVHIGPHAQEGELCRRSTLYASITARDARPFYDANNECGGSLYTNGVLVTPHAEVFREIGYLTMETPVVVSVISSPAPYRPSLQDMSQEDLFAAVKKRIQGIFAVAADAGYRHLVLGAWGCGSNGNDPAVIAHAFRAALDEPLAAATFADLFDTVTFAISDATGSKANLEAFQAEFSA